ncbi:MAG: hypothetical protein HZB82_03115 [Deltaproteobacteria bacterium]|nr:hypothetical protein [Deltaproteobacteria bacterium]
MNQNIEYKGTVYHVQTEDGGVKNPAVTTLLFVGGNILASKKTSYADILKSDQLDAVVKGLIKEQHASVVKGLLDGAYNKQGEEKP